MNKIFIIKVTTEQYDIEPLYQDQDFQVYAKNKEEAISKAINHIKEMNLIEVQEITAKIKYEIIE